jgi:HEAT repeat protein
LGTIWNTLQHYATQGKESTQELVRALDDPHRVVRTVAALALSYEARHAEKCIPVLIESLNHDCAGSCTYDYVERWDVMSLACLGHLAAPALLEQIRLQRNIPLAVMALENMGKDGERIVPQLISAIDDPRSSIAFRRQIVATLGRMGTDDAKAHDALLRRIKDRSENEEVRAAAVEGLGMVGRSDTRSMLWDFREDKSPKVREAVRKALDQ